ncbi:hypothetical protein ALC60_00341 [Trachymyrmex zeteki]|uniref:Gustatory receptor n=1 Tax=Mycetomoellerius zeteki TaxID=64791 RepID=A0A151XJX5_9HYME|nr:hypothetical protein ALC60_00341 [Trachymyrmex zeteki]
MVDTIQKAFRPLSLIAFLIGSGNLRYPLNYWRFRLSVFYVIIVWSLYKYVFDAMLIAYTPKHIFNNHLSYYSTQTNIFVTLISVTITVLKHQKIHICIKKLSLVDDTLEKLGTPKEYHTIQNLIRSTLIIYFIVVLILFITDSIWNIEKHNNIKAMFIGLIMGYPIYVSTLGNIIFAFVVRYIGTRLDKINGYIEQLSETEECGLRFKWEKSLIVRHYVCNSENRKRVIWTVMHLHLELCRIARDINDLFGTQLTLQMISCFFILVTTFFAQYHMILCLTYIYENNSAKLKLILANDIWCIVFLIKFISLNYICENASAKRMWMFIKRLAAVDDTLKELGIPKLYRKLHIRIKRILIGWLVCSQIINIIDMIWWFYTIGNYWCLIIPYVTNHYQHVNVLVDLLFITFLWFVYYF